jgi:hypothetical protein
MKCKCGCERFLSSYDKVTKERVAWVCADCSESIPVEKSKVTKDKTKKKEKEEIAEDANLSDTE